MEVDLWLLEDDRGALRNEIRERNNGQHLRHAESNVHEVRAGFPARDDDLEDSLAARLECQGVGDRRSFQPLGYVRDEPSTRARRSRLPTRIGACEQRRDRGLTLRAEISGRLAVPVIAAMWVLPQGTEVGDI